MAASVSTDLREAWIDQRLAELGHWLQRHGGIIRSVQWAVVAVYLILVAVPAFLPLPDRTAHLWNNLTVLAQFAFWGIWWPFVLVSMVLVGRAWCGVLCPEGTLTEFASRWSLGRAVPRWITWGGWPFIAFAGTTVYGRWSASTATRSRCSPSSAAPPWRRSRWASSMAATSASGAAISAP